jgi:hypothetical protein
MRHLMRRALWAAVWLVAFAIVLVATFFVVETVFPSAADPGPHGFGPVAGAGVARGILVSAFGFFTARFLADRVVPLRPRLPKADT